MQSAKVALSDGRTLAYAEYGDPTGYPLIWCHGNPGSRREADLLEPTLLQRLGVRAIVPDRPGIGLSTWRAHRKLTDWTTDLAVLTAALKIERFALLGLSGGAPYALATARAMPHRIIRAGIVSGIGPLDVLDAAARRERAAGYFMMARRAYWGVYAIGWLMQRGLRQPDKLMAQVLEGLPPVDQAVLSDPRTRQSFLNLLHEAFRQGPRGLAWDATLIARPWGFSLREIKLPVNFWHGDADRNAPLAMGGYLAEQLANSYLHILPGEGHFSVAVRHMPAILQTLIGAEEAL
ncbi:MAG: alpha/beta hydrolase [Caldilineaceae bacterium]|nr:alpha/beta hydrolase [Caldilineaceae bacterium]